MSASTCSLPRAALTRNAPPAAPSRLSLRNSARFKQPVGLRRGRQQADQDFRARQERVEPRRAVERLDARQGLRRAAPAGDPKPEPRQHAGRLAADHAQAHDPDRDLVRRRMRVRLPDAARAAARRRGARGCDASARAARRIRRRAWSDRDARRARSEPAAGVGSVSSASTPAPMLTIAFRLGRLASRPCGGRQTKA